MWVLDSSIVEREREREIICERKLIIKKKKIVKGNYLQHR
jgi:hypothetical protein